MAAGPKTRCILLLLALLAACAETPRQPVTVIEVIPDEEVRPLSAREQVAALLAQAETSVAPTQQSLQLQAAALLLQERQPGLAEELLSTMEADRLTDSQSLEYALQRAEIHMQFGENRKALNWLNNRRVRAQLEGSDIPTLLRASEIRASAYAREGSHLQAARERIYIHPLLDDERIAANRDAIWNSLSRAPSEQLSQPSGLRGNEDFRGWLELAFVAKNNQGDIDAQLRQLDDWLQRWPQHPAANPLPGGLDQLRIAVAERPRQLALILPFSGKLARYSQAIRDGLIAAWYQTKAQGGTVPLIRSYDTEGASIAELVNTAVADGAEMIIGPLRKEAVHEVIKAAPEGVTVLALNRVDSLDQPPARLFQFGLTPADEARQIADIAYAEGHRRALVLMPDSQWGSNVADIFAARWQELGGTLTSSARFDASKKNYSKVVQGLLNLDQSKQRARELRQVTGQRFEFLPYRRSDMDMMFLIARPDEARAIKPLLAFHYAGDVPVYATSHVYRGVQEPDKNRDINNIRFTDIPWVLEESLPLREMVNQAFPANRSYQRMYALGVDSFRLYPRLLLLKNLDNSRVYGETGTLRLNSQQQVLRELHLAHFRDGKAVNIPIVDTYTTREALMETPSVR